VIELNERVDLLRKIHLFAGLKLDQVSGVAAIFEEREMPNGQVIFKYGDKPDGFYILFKGRVKVTRPNKKGEEDILARLTVGDYFGEEALFENRDRSATITTIDNCVFLFLSRAGFESLLSKHENLKPNFTVAIKNKLARSKDSTGWGRRSFTLLRRHTSVCIRRWWPHSLSPYSAWLAWGAVGAVTRMFWPGCHYFLS
jgi:signal-transduction protein with cAMP-binding, CBS, and nucleotidyltransferase domain